MIFVSLALKKLSKQTYCMVVAVAELSTWLCCSTKESCFFCQWGPKHTGKKKPYRFELMITEFRVNYPFKHILNTTLRPRRLQTHVKVLLCWMEGKTERPQSSAFMHQEWQSLLYTYCSYNALAFKDPGSTLQPSPLFSSERARPITVSNKSHQLYEVCWLWWACIGSWTQELFWEHGLLHPHIVQSRLWKLSAMQFTIKICAQANANTHAYQAYSLNNMKNERALPVRAFTPMVVTR